MMYNIEKIISKNEIVGEELEFLLEEIELIVDLDFLINIIVNSC